jgi:methyl-accepting chemotaxis protein
VNGFYCGPVRAGAAQKPHGEGGTISAVVVGSVLFSRTIVGQFGGKPSAAVALAQQVAAGCATCPMAQLKTMHENLHKIIGLMCSGSGSIASSSTAIAHGNNDLSKRTGQNAAMVEEMATGWHLASRKPTRPSTQASNAPDA